MSETKDLDLSKVSKRFMELRALAHPKGPPPVAKGEEVVLWEIEQERLHVMAREVKARLEEWGCTVMEEIPPEVMLRFLIRLYCVEEDAINVVAAICAHLSGVPYRTMVRNSEALNAADRKREQIAKKYGLSGF